MHGFVFKNPVEMTNRELEQEYKALFHYKVTEFLEDNEVPRTLKEYFREHILNVELEYILRNS